MTRLALLIACLLTPAAATAQSATGQWQCETSAKGPKYINTWNYRYTLTLDPNGSFQAQGSYFALSAGYTVPFQAQGQWQQRPDGVIVQGMANIQRTPVPVQFWAGFTSVQPRMMSFQTDTTMNHVIYMCQR